MDDVREAPSHGSSLVHAATLAEALRLLLDAKIGDAGAFAAATVARAALDAWDSDIAAAEALIEKPGPPRLVSRPHRDFQDYGLDKLNRDAAEARRLK